jgi:hypothetical protein
MAEFDSGFSSAFDVAAAESPGSPGSPGDGLLQCGAFCWVEPFVCDECCTLDLAEVSQDLRDRAARWAAGFLWAATGRQYGGCPRTYRPCREECPPVQNCCGGYAGPSIQSVPWRVPGSFDWVNLPCGTCKKGCQCSAVSEVWLSDVDQVLNVRIDGVDYDPCGMVAVYDRSRVVRIDGGSWPVCQELGKVDGPGTWSITVLEGQCVPDGGDWVTGTLMCEFLKSCLKRDDCQLPRRLQTITRQGVTLGFNDRFENLSIMRTGIWEIDAWIEETRFVGAATPSIISPELPRHTELTWPRAIDCAGSS